jgi:hypothetical protein
VDLVDTPAAPPAQENTLETGLVEVLRRASVTIDFLWRTALAEGASDLALKLGEASHGVHRALIALSPPVSSAA